MNIVKDLFLVPTEPVVEVKEEGEIVENAIVDSFRRDKNNLKMLMEVSPPTPSQSIVIRRSSVRTSRGDDHNQSLPRSYVIHHR